MFGRTITHNHQEPISHPTQNILVTSPDHRWLSPLLGCEGKKKKKNLHRFGGQSAGSAWEIFHLLDLTKVKALLCPTNQRARSPSLSLLLWHETRFIISLSHKIPFTVYSVKFLFPLFLSVCARAVRTAHIIPMGFLTITNVSVAQCDSVWL